MDAKGASRAGARIGWVLAGALALLPAARPGPAPAETFAPATLRRIVAEVGSRPHPRLLFSDLKRTTGWRNRGKAPWKGFAANIEKAVAQRLPICRVCPGPATGAMVHAGGRAHEGEMLFDPSLLGIRYHLTGDPRTLADGIAALLAAEVPRRGADDATGEDDLPARLLMRYSLLFDLLAASMPGPRRSEISVRLAGFADALHEEYPRSRNPIRRLMLGSALGVAALALAGEKTGARSGPADWLTVATIDLFVADRCSWPAAVTRDGPRSALRGVANRGGFTGSTGYRSYWLGILCQYLRIYREATGRNPFADFPLVRRVVAEPVASPMPLRLDPLQTTSRGQTWDWFAILWDLFGEPERDAFAWYAQDDDAVSGPAEHDYAFAFHLTSFGKRNTDPKGDPGQVAGALSLAGEPVDWDRSVRSVPLTGERQSVLVERRAGVSADVPWRTTGGLGREVRLRLFSAPVPAGIEVWRGWGFIPTLSGPETGNGEVDHPFLLLAGSAGAGGVECDGRAAFLRVEGGRVVAAALVGGTVLRHEGTKVLAASCEVRSVAARRAGGAWEVSGEAESAFRLTMDGEFPGGTLDRHPESTFDVLFGAPRLAPEKVPRGASVACPAGPFALRPAPR